MEFRPATETPENFGPYIGQTSADTVEEVRWTGEHWERKGLRVDVFYWMPFPDPLPLPNPSVPVFIASVWLTRDGTYIGSCVKASQYDAVVSQYRDQMKFTRVRQEIVDVIEPTPSED